jgi:hypothetical protein
VFGSQQPEALNTSISGTSSQPNTITINVDDDKLASYEPDASTMYLFKFQLPNYYIKVFSTQITIIH